MLGRVTQRSIALNSLNNLQASQARSSKLQEQLTSGKAYAKPSDNPVAAGNALRLHEQVAVNTEHARNIGDAQAWMTTQENALDGALSALQKVRDLTVQAASTGSNDGRARAAVAAQLREIKEQLVSSANTTHMGRPVFAGTSTATEAYTAVTDTDGKVTGYTPNDDRGAVTRAVAPGVEVQVNLSGAAVFGDDTGSVFTEIDELIAAVNGTDGAAISEKLSVVDARLDKVTNGLATIGARVNQLDALQEAGTARADFLGQQLDEVEGVDLAKTFVEYNLQSTAYQAALQSTAKVIQPTLLDFLR
ncbi:flagellar hook-associated protein FlgL [Paenibacillus sp. TRM 82003]|uniref:flagellar hook-associated protein FlgL n=1 Tax=Kineococcus sp. TRM81007 TaxID=2925831 RepID=UPI001F59E265|nr:flagellar hook-associated protein FlgL [Kineococcus sp. TRM81007]MCI2240635.1 flagellar hook-associated protein FlgL [Kineococcus sp. TRM81007]MCI3925442.1 flagellar hook-associated protein FlgL [Paenibacillus sp. TRM 82003]